MPRDMMLKCERKKLFVINGERVWQWAEVAASSLATGEQDIRCIHCHGRVRVHKKGVEHGPQDHVEHLSAQDSENCRGGCHFKGEHRMSLQPVT